MLAIIGNIEGAGTHISQKVEGQEEIVDESGYDEKPEALETHNETHEMSEESASNAGTNTERKRIKSD